MPACDSQLLNRLDQTLLVDLASFLSNAMWIIIINYTPTIANIYVGSGQGRNMQRKL